MRIMAATASRSEERDMSQFLQELDLKKTRAICADIRNMKKPSHRQDALLNLKKELHISASKEWLGIGVPYWQGEEGLQVYQEFANLYAELNNYSQNELRKHAAVCYWPPASQAQVAQWHVLKSKFTAPPYNFALEPAHVADSQGTTLDDQLRPLAPPDIYTNKTAYILEPYWSDIVKVLETEPVCPLHDHKGVTKEGNPPHYFFIEGPRFELLGTSDPQSKPLFDFRPCRSLLCPGAHVDKVRKCSRCGQAAYCSKECQKAHWPLHKLHCKAASRSPL